jgi:hypothetical protein
MKMNDEESLLRKMGSDLLLIDSRCCGMAGPFRFESEKFAGAAPPSSSKTIHPSPNTVIQTLVSQATSQFQAHFGSFLKGIICTIRHWTQSTPTNEVSMSRVSFQITG